MGLTLEDRQEIKDLFFRYAYALDKGRNDPDLESVYTDDAVTESPLHGRREGPDLFDKQRSRPNRGDILTRHVITNFRMDGDGERANVTAYLLEFITWLTPRPPHATPTTDFAYAGHYDCTVRKVDGKWLLERRVVHLDHRRAD